MNRTCIVGDRWTPPATMGFWGAVTGLLGTIASGIFGLAGAGQASSSAEKRAQMEAEAQLAAQQAAYQQELAVWEQRIELEQLAMAERATEAQQQQQLLATVGTWVSLAVAAGLAVYGLNLVLKPEQEMERAGRPGSGRP